MALGSTAAILPLRIAELLTAAAPRCIGRDLRIAVIERTLRQDPGDLGRRAAAIAHYSRQAQAVLDSRGAAASAGAQRQQRLEEPLGRAREHLEYVLKATEDIGRLHHVLTVAFGAKLFYELPELTARYMRKIGLHRDCLEEFGTRSEFEERATPYHFANALSVLKAAGCAPAARELYEEAVQLEWQGQRPIRWRSFEQTPAVHIDGLDHHPYWEGARRPAIADVMESNFEAIRADLDDLLRRRPAGGGAGGFLGGLSPAQRAPANGAVPQSVAAYPNLVEDAGVWDMLQVYVSRRWHEEACALMPRTSALLREHLPTTSSPYVHYNSEEMVLFLLAPGTRVRLHNGGSNAPLNLHMGVSGCEGAHIEVAGQARELRNGAVLCFDDGTDHRVWHDGREERWVLVVRMMHPQLVARSAEYYSRAFTRRTCFEAWGEERHSRLLAGIA